MRLEALPESDDLGAKGCFIAFVVNDIVGQGGLFGVGNLVGEAEAGIGFSGFASRARRADAGDVAGDFEIVRRGDEDDAIDAATPIGEDALAFAAGAGVANHFKDEGGLDDGDGGWIVREDLFHPVLLGGDDGGMDDGVELVEGGRRGRRVRRAWDG